MSIKIESKGTEVKLTIEHVQGTAHTWSPSFTRNACNPFHAELEVMALNKAVKEVGKKLAREILEGLLRRQLPGSKRGRLRSAVESIKGIYSL